VLEDAHDNGVPSKHTTGAQVHQRQVILIDDLDDLHDLVDDLDNDIPSKHTTGAQVHHKKVVLDIINNGGTSKHIDLVLDR
jgi:hypothetical protein